MYAVAVSKVKRRERENVVCGVKNKDANGASLFRLEDEDKQGPGPAEIRSLSV